MSIYESLAIFVCVYMTGELNRAGEGRCQRAPPALFLYACFLHRDADDLTVDADKELRLGKTSEPIGNLLVL